MMSENRIGYIPPYTAHTGTADHTGTLEPGVQTLFISTLLDLIYSHGCTARLVIYSE